MMMEDLFRGIIEAHATDWRPRQQAFAKVSKGIARRDISSLATEIDVVLSALRITQDPTTIWFSSPSPTPVYPTYIPVEIDSDTESSIYYTPKSRTSAARFEFEHPPKVPSLLEWMNGIPPNSPPTGDVDDNRSIADTISTITQSVAAVSLTRGSDWSSATSRTFRPSWVGIEGLRSILPGPLTDYGVAYLKSHDCSDMEIMAIWIMMLQCPPTDWSRKICEMFPRMPRARADWAAKELLKKN